ncbi:MAG: helix-turn-helix transcriptional regulator [Bacilli bacterium]|nr:helix-turn-helix transcriptional regulator [Bacilli bacterium]
MRKVTKIEKPNFNSSIGEKIKYLRTNRNISQYELGRAVYKSRQEINYFENGTRKVDLDTLILIAKHLEVSLDYLVGLNDIEKPNTDLQGIFEITGLSEKSIHQLSKYKSSKNLLTDFYEDYEIEGVEKEGQKLNELNKLIESPKFEEVLDYLVEYNNLKSGIKSHPSKLAFQRNQLENMEDKKSLLEYKITKKIAEILNDK